MKFSSIQTVSRNENGFKEIQVVLQSSWIDKLLRRTTENIVIELRGSHWYHKGTENIADQVHDQIHAELNKREYLSSKANKVFTHSEYSRLKSEFTNYD